MATLTSHFNDLISEIRPTKAQQKSLQDAHRRLRERLFDDECLKSIIVSVFLQGSYRRATATRPQGDDKLDVDMVVVTRLKHEDFPNPEDAMDVFVPFMEKHYIGKWEKKGRSIGIEMSNVKLDVVIASAPSEEESYASDFLQGYSTLDDLPLAQDEYSDSLLEFLGLKEGGPQWKSEPLYIPDREAKLWQRTHPLEQIRWTTDKNKATDGHYVNIVRLVKWWWRTQYPDLKYPKGYPLEHMVGECCPDSVTTLAGGFTETLEELTRRYQAYVSAGIVPFLSDRGVPEHNVLKRLSPGEFAAFHGRVQEAGQTARTALETEDTNESATMWRKLFGSKFPAPPSKSSTTAASVVAGGYSARTRSSRVGGGRFA